MAGFIALLHLVGFGILILVVVPGHYRVGTGLFGLGTGITAYTLGARHAFDADHIAAIVVLFGLGFDTVTEITLLVLAGTSVAAGLPWYAIMCLPILFAAGMSLLDTIDGSFMNFAYGWAFSKPVRKVYYNITITGLSVAVALFIGTVELVGLLTDKLGAHGSVAEWFQNFNINTAGFIIVATFVGTWSIALSVWR